MQSRQAVTDTMKLWRMVMLTSYLTLSKISSRFWVTTTTQQITIIVRRARRLLQLAFCLALSSKAAQPKYWHSLSSSTQSSSLLRKRLVAKMSSSMSQNSLRGASLVLLKRKSRRGVMSLLKRRWWSMLMSSLVVLRLSSLRKKMTLTRQCMNIMKACRLCCSMMIRTKRREMLPMQRQLSHRVHLVSPDKCSGSSNQRYLQVSCSFSNSRNTRQQRRVRAWQGVPLLTIDPNRQTQQPKSTHSSMSIWSTWAERMGGLPVLMRMLCPYPCIIYILGGG